MATLTAIIKYLSAMRAAVQKDSEGKPAILTFAIGLFVFIIAILVVAAFIILSPILLIIGSYIILGGDSKYPAYMTEVKDTCAYLTYEAQSNNWGTTSCPTYNNREIEDADEEDTAVFYGSSALWDRYAYSVSDGIIIEKTDTTALIKYTEPTRYWYDEEGNPHPYPFYYAEYTGLNEECELWKLFNVGDKVVRGQRFAKLGTGRMRFRTYNPDKELLSPYVFSMDGIDIAPDIIYPPLDVVIDNVDDMINIGGENKKGDEINEEKQ